MTSLCPARSPAPTDPVGIAASPVVAGMSLDSVFTSIDPALAARNRPLVRALASRRDRTPLGLSAVRVRKLRDRLEAFNSALPSDSSVYAELNRHLLLAESADLTSRQRQACPNR